MKIIFQKSNNNPNQYERKIIMSTPFVKKMDLNQLKESIDNGMDAQAILDKYEIKNYTLQSKSHELAIRENSMTYCISVPGDIPPYEIKVTNSGRLSIPKALLEHEGVKSGTKFMAVFEKNGDIHLRKVKPATKSKKK